MTRPGLGSGAFHLAVKDLRLLSRDRIALFWVLGFPIIFALFIGAVVRAGLSGEAGPLRVILVDPSGSKATGPVLAALGRHARLSVAQATLDEAKRAVRRADAVAYLSLPLADDSSRASLPEIGFDPAREMEAAYVEHLFVEALGGLRGSGAVQANAGTPTVRKVSVASAGIAPRSASDIVFPSAVLWGLMGCAACFAVSLVAERTRGTYLRLGALPLTRNTILAGKALSALFASLAVGLFLTSVGVLGFDVKVESAPKLLVALVCTALCFVGITMALSVLGKSEQAVAGAGWATLLLMAMLGGAMVPLSWMPEWLGPVSQLSPVKWGILALEGATWRTFSTAELVVPCSILLGVGGLSFLFGSVLFSRSRA